MAALHGAAKLVEYAHRCVAVRVVDHASLACSGSPELAQVWYPFTTVLVVPDETTVADVVNRWLRGLGHDLTTDSFCVSTAALKGMPPLPGQTFSPEGGSSGYALLDRPSVALLGACRLNQIHPSWFDAEEDLDMGACTRIALHIHWQASVVDFMNENAEAAPDDEDVSGNDGPLPVLEYELATRVDSPGGSPLTPGPESSDASMTEEPLAMGGSGLVPAQVFESGTEGPGQVLTMSVEYALAYLSAVQSVMYGTDASKSEDGDEAYEYAQLQL